MNEVTGGTLLGGRVQYRQFAKGHRSGFEPILLAAAIPAKPGEKILEAGCGAGAALLCLAHRVPGILGIGAEIDPALVDLANENFRNNNLQNIHAEKADATALPHGAIFDHVMANPPWHDAAGTTSPDRGRALAHHAGPGLLAAWAVSLTACLKPRGTITFILPAAAFPEAAACLTAQGCGGFSLLPLWPRTGQPAKQIIISAARGAKSPAKILPGLVLHDEAGISPEAEAVLRGAGRLMAF
jgi:tRNA1(Val) A37 N6-methylase TrmN6